jgi:hypothetical protein
VSRPRAARTRTVRRRTPAALGGSQRLSRHRMLDELLPCLVRGAPRSGKRGLAQWPP